MNTSQFMDKQIMDLSSASSLSPPHNNSGDKDFIDLMNSQQENDHQNQRGDNAFESKKEEIVPSYDFQPIRATVGLSQSASHLAGSANISSTSTVWSASDTKFNSSSPIRNYGSLDSSEPAKFVPEKDRNFSDTAILSEIDRTMKKHADNLLHVLEGVSARLTQLEARSCNLEQLVDDLNISVENNCGSAEGKMRQLENILREVQTGVQELKDKQEIVEAQVQLSKLQVSKADQRSKTQNHVPVESTGQPSASAPQSHLQPSPPVSYSQPLPQVLPPSSAVPPPALPQQNLPPKSAQHPVQFPSTQQEPYFPPSGQPQPSVNQSLYQLPPPAQPHQPAPGAPPPHQLPYQPSSQPPPYSQAPLPQPPQLQSPSSGYCLEESPYSPQTFPPNPPQQSPSQPPTVSASSQQYYGAPPSMYEKPSGRSNSGFGSQPGSGEPYPYGGMALSQFGSTSPLKPPHMSSSGTGYPQPATARPLPHALPMASGVSSGGSGSPRSGNRVPVDDVVDKVTSMGFPREHVRATVRKLTENGQAVDLNVVLDKLMNNGAMQQPPQRGGWYGGR